MNMRTKSESGAGLVEMMIAVMLISVIFAAMIGTAVQQQRFYLIAGDAANAVATLERLETITSADLLPLNGGAGDITYAGPDSVAVRAYRGAYAICAKYATSPVVLTVRPLTEAHAPQPDSGIVYSSGLQPTPADDHWAALLVRSVKADTCPDGSRAYDLAVEGLEGILSEIPVGAPIRLYHRGSYWLTTESGEWSLKTDALLGKSTLVGGPLAPADSAAGSVLTFRYLNRSGSVTTHLDSIATIEIDATTLGAVATWRSGEPLRKVRTVSIRLRNAEF
ncbi:MAG: hypothetical protein PVI01_18745 [Gemmatimonadales bacterium]|jgi:hypothetical protein